MTYEQRKQIKVIVSSLIKILKIDCPVNLDKLVSTLGGKIDYNIIDNCADGMVTKNSNGEFVISLSENQSSERRRFTIAHELGHLFLHMGFPNDDWNPKKKIFFRYGYSELEYQANEFAACLLMPEKIFIDIVNTNLDKSGNVNVINVARYFEVSESAVINRGKWLGVFEW